MRPGERPGDPVAPPRFQCALCGSRFAQGLAACGTCPFRRGCDVVCCPDCGYQFPRSSRLADWLGSWWGRKEDS